MGALWEPQIPVGCQDIRPDFFAILSLNAARNPIVKTYSQGTWKKGGGVTQAPHAQDPGNTPEASLASSPPETNISDNSIVQNGVNSNNPQPAAQTGNTSAKTGPAPAALRREYQTRVADAIQAGDYERAYALYREYRNPELRAFKDFYARKTFTEYADANGYGLVPDTAVGTE